MPIWFYYKVNGFGPDKEATLCENFLIYYIAIHYGGIHSFSYVSISSYNMLQFNSALKWFSY